MIVLDTSAIMAAANRADRNHADVVDALAREAGPLILPVPILSEIGYMIETALGVRVAVEFLGNVAAGGFILDCCLEDAPSARRLVERYASLPLGVSDAYVASCTHRSGRRVMTLDRRHFDVLAAELGFAVLP